MNEQLLFEQVLEVQNKAVQFENLRWQRYEIFTFQFWILIALLILPWFVWWRLVDKKRILEIIIYGLIVVTFATVLDELGCQLNLWEYRYDIEPLFPRLISINFTVLPIAYMLIYQYFTSWKTFIAASVVAAAGYSFIGEPIMVLLDIYEMLNWRHVFSFPIYIILGIIFKAILNAILKIHHQAHT